MIMSKDARMSQRGRYVVETLRKYGTEEEATFDGSGGQFKGKVMATGVIMAGTMKINEMRNQREGNVENKAEVKERPTTNIWGQGYHGLQKLPVQCEESFKNFCVPNDFGACGNSDIG
jgi:hypothetical protein